MIRYKREGFRGQKLLVLPLQVIRQLENDPWINDLYLTAIGFYPDAAMHYRERKEGSPEHILIYCIKGRGWVEFDDQRFLLGENQFIIIPRNTPHRYASHSHDPWSIYWIHFIGNKSDFFTKAIDTPGELIRSDYDRLNERTALFDEMYLNLEMGFGKEILCYVNLTLGYFLSSFLFVSHFRLIRRVRELDSLSNATDYMKENVDKALSLSDLAEKSGYSSSHFTKLFKIRTGCTPVDYFINLKMQRACQYLELSDFRVKEIAYLLGYHDPYYFSRLFNKHIGISPRQYRRNRKG